MKKVIKELTVYFRPGDGDEDSDWHNFEKGVNGVRDIKPLNNGAAVVSYTDGLKFMFSGLPFSCLYGTKKNGEDEKPLVYEFMKNCGKK